VFSHKHPRTTARATLGRRIGAAITTIALGGAFSLAGAASAGAAPSDNTGDHVSWAQAQFLSGSIAGVDLDTVASVEPAEAWNDGDAPTMTDKDPLAVKALDAVTVGTGDSVQVTTDGVQAGVLGQFASASADGRSFAAAGAVLDDGGVGVGQDVSMPGADADVDLSGAVGGQFTSTLTGLRLSVNAIGAQAEADGGDAEGDYTLDGAVLHFSSPSISQLTEKVDAALDSIDNGIDLLDGDDGTLVADLNQILQRVSPSLNLLGGNATVTATVNAGDLRGEVEDLLESEYGASGVTFDLETGVVSVDLAKLHGGNLNNLPVGTELLSSPVIGSVLSSITGKVATIADQVVDRVEAALNDATVAVHADLDLDVAQAPLVKKVCETVKKIIQVPTQVLTQVTIQVPVVNGAVAQIVNGVPVVNGVPIVGDLVGGTLGGILGGTQQTVTWVTQTVDKYVTKNISKTVDEVVCHNEETPLPSLKTSADIDIAGTVDQFIAGDGVTSSADVKLLGIIDHSFDLDLALDAIGDSLGTTLFGTDGAIGRLAAALDTGLVQPAVEGLLDGDDAVGIALTDILSAKVNLQELEDGTFTQTALRITALGGLGSGAGLGGILGTSRTATGLAQVDLAQASVGPNVIRVEDPCVGDCGVGGETTTPPGGVVGGGLLAMTGVNIAMLILMVLALLAAGAYLVRDSYRHRFPAAPAA
jgi:hypothetical protein